MVNLMLGGFSPKELALYCGDSVRTLQTWLKNVDERGWETLIATKRTGRPAKLTNAQVEEIKAAIVAGPEASGFDVWNGLTLSEYIKNQYNVEYGVRACQILMHRMGLALIRPQTYPSLENPDEEARENFKKMTEVTQDTDIVPVFQDEVHFQAQTTITRVWAEKGSEPKVMSKPGKNNIAYSGFVVPETGELYVTKPGWFNFETVIQSMRDFLENKPCPEGKKYCLILDNAPWHKKAIRLIWTEGREEYADIREKLDNSNVE